MLNLYGTYTFIRDEKGRIQTPSSFFDDLFPLRKEKTILVMTSGPDKCIYSFNHNTWSYYVQQLRNLVMPNHDKLALIRRVLSHATNCKVDRQRRVKIPDKLAEYAGIKNEVEIVGFIDRLELWAPDVHEKYLDKLEREKFNYDEACRNLFIDMMPKTFDGNESSETEEVQEDNREPLI